ncbi:hypothetical protein HELRODRAFT_186129 [Helobdella robusta]|uniref:PCI domain-containing protein n=1 Tax=Helobdella robusta TaxID=6412 RepID=T1FNP8_HELRO|nr:hypothetical protein HELRODRAFT_186129 [Helobdella robusta]ESN92467.1 hypothetical protein HELRODRAFT_186129 [Helobdella robusta]
MLKEPIKNVEMKDVEKKEEVVEEVKKDADTLVLEDLKQYIKHIEKAVITKEPRFMSRTLRALVNLRKRLNNNVLHRAIVGYFLITNNSTHPLLEYIDEPMETQEKGPTFRPRVGKQASTPLLVEIDIYLHLLVLIYLLDQNKLNHALQCADQLMDKIALQNRRTLDMLAARCYFYFARAYELTNQFDRIRSTLHARLCTCTLKSDHEGQATLLNLLLRNYLHYNLYDQAAKLIAKATFPESSSNNEWARYLYYTGRVKAIQLEYSSAHTDLMQALRKAPQHTAVGFKQIVQKFAITVELLLGDIPDKSTFRQASLRKTLQPYFQLTQAVRTGNLARFNQVLEKFKGKFELEGTYSLIVRLRHNVIKTGVRIISQSYSRISLLDIARKLQLGSPEDAEFIVAKAIRDGVIEATIDHEKKYVQSKENPDIYSTKEPMTAFHQRITFCLNLHNQSIKAMRFPPKSYNKDLESAEERREREQQELESAKEIAEEDFDDF